MIEWMKALETLAIICNVAGILLLFRYGMPYRVPTRDGIPTITWVSGKGDEPHAPTVRADRLYARLGKLGLALIVVSNTLLVGLIWW